MENDQCLVCGNNAAILKNSDMGAKDDKLIFTNVYECPFCHAAWEV